MGRAKCRHHNHFPSLQTQCPHSFAPWPLHATHTAHTPRVKHPSTPLPSPLTASAVTLYSLIMPHIHHE